MSTTSIEKDKEPPWEYLLNDESFPNKHMTRVMHIKNKLEYHIRNKIPIQEKNRAKIWAIMENLDSIVTNQKNIDKYYECLNTPHEEIDNDVATDAVRTFPSKQYKQIMKDNHNGKKDPLYNVLKSYAIYNEEVQYTQGMNYLCLILLCYYTEIEAFWMLDLLIKKYGMRHFFRKRGSFVPSYLKFFEQEIQEQLPQLSNHFQKEGIQVYMFVQGWLCTIFVYQALPFQTISVIWDYFWYESNAGMGIEVLFKLSIALLKIINSSLLDVPMSQFFEFVKQEMTKVDPLEWIHEAYNVKLTDDTSSLLSEIVKNYQDCEKKDSRISEFIIATSKSNYTDLSFILASNNNNNNTTTTNTNVNDQNQDDSDTDIDYNKLLFLSDDSDGDDNYDEDATSPTLEREKSCIIS
ncbi:RabGAP/TBC domain-containing protein [Tieghemostelium lacteum]|uniref:RabGAP/TBC domain-containing protein n=1 Tax=Tieghemostelium lacteum TaxID=361077 RepID=A0A151ZH48_TIELA|nr:RabGAP/TBC domain-containing protein [Tieghemostelium lacteum]|eukprot:KYQ93200.1 RabGAP/TBC domain-containing protein [Tieghemostelium lacteum]